MHPAQPSGDPTAPERGPLRVALVLPDVAAPEPGALRLIEALLADPRCILAGFWALPAPAAAMPALTALILAAEARLFPPPNRVEAPLWAAARGAIPRLGAGEAPKGPGVDVIVDLSLNPLALRLAGHARAGLWRLDAYGAEAGLTQALRRRGRTPAALWRHRPRGAATVLARADFDVKFLATRNRAFLREKAVQLVLRELGRLHLTGDAGGPERPAPLAPPPRNRDLPPYLLRTAGTLIRRAGDGAARRAGFRPGMFRLRLAPGDLADFDPAAGRELTPPRGRYWADPFLWRHSDGQTYLFYEDYVYATRRGHIGVARIAGERAEPLGPALSAPHHLSYPHVFGHGGDVFMLPETHQAGRVEIWRATDFPTGWTLYATALDGTGAVDCGLAVWNGDWWLFANLCHDSFGDYSGALHLYRTDGPGLGRIDPHPLNPVVVGSATARGGGRIFVRNGRLYRMAQENTHGTYGYGLLLMEITALTPDRYEERVLRRIAPDSAPGLIGCHHADAADGLVAFDVRHR